MLWTLILLTCTADGCEVFEVVKPSMEYEACVVLMDKKAKENRNKLKVNQGYTCIRNKPEDITT